MSALITIVIPTYNRAHVISRAIDSVVKQTFPHWELIIVDDGSNDDTGKVVEMFLEDSRIKYYCQRNQGVSAARNLGAEKSSGTYLVFLDSDDFLVENGLSLFYNVYIKKKVDIIFSSCCIIESNIERIRQPHNLGAAFAKVTGLFMAGTFCVKKVLFNKVHGYSESLKFGENYELGLKISNTLKTYELTNDYTVIYNMDPVNRVSNKLENKLYSNIYFLSHHKEFLKKDTRLYSNILSQAGYFYLALSNYSEARKYLTSAFYVEPFNEKNLFRVFKFFYKYLLVK